MGYRFLIVIAVLSLMAGCAAFDTDSTPYAGFNPDEVVFPTGMSGPYNGSFTGTMTLDSSTCQGVSDEVGAAVPLNVDVVQSDKIINITFEDATVSAGELSAENKAILVVQTGSTKHVYYLTFSEDSKIDGTCEVIEADADGQYVKACGSYTAALAKAEKSE
ncbi:MAG: hypothetical protein WC956_04980 [bacterium]